MADQIARELEQALWKALRSDPIVMLGLDGIEDGHLRPMTAQLDPTTGDSTDEGVAEEDSRGGDWRVPGNPGALWFFTASDNALVRDLERSDRAIATFASKDHELFATIEGNLRLDQDRAMVDLLWNPFVAAWYDGKEDPRLALLRLDPTHAEIWRNATGLVAGVRILLGGDPREDYKDDFAHVNLH